jgi:ElaB/YqjD/DUF883 family membrane-anchored ribosome-binding protein
MDIVPCFVMNMGRALAGNSLMQQTQAQSYTVRHALADIALVPSFLQWVSRRRRRWIFRNAPRGINMNSETTDNLGTMSTMNTTGSTGLNGNPNVVHRVAQKAHETLDKLEQTVSTGSERMMSMQEEYGSYAREHIKAHPLSTVAGAFVVGMLLGKILR